MYFLRKYVETGPNCPHALATFFKSCIPSDILFYFKIENGIFIKKISILEYHIFDLYKVLETEFECAEKNARKLLPALH